MRNNTKFFLVFLWNTNLSSFCATNSYFFKDLTNFQIFFKRLFPGLFTFFCVICLDQIEICQVSTCRLVLFVVLQINRSNKHGENVKFFTLPSERCSSGKKINTQWLKWDLLLGLMLIRNLWMSTLVQSRICSSHFHHGMFYNIQWSYKLKLTHILCYVCPFIPWEPYIWWNQSRLSSNYISFCYLSFSFMSTSPKDVNRFARILKRDDLKNNTPSFINEP